MKKSIFIAAALSVSVFVYSSCSSSNNNEKLRGQATTQDSTYECPMKCEGSKSNKPGKCPMCDMELEKK